MPMHRSTVSRHAAAALCLAAGLAACGEHEFHPPDRGAQVAAADSMYSPTMFDTITWASDSLRLFEGNNTFGAECRRCHGYLGRGETDYAREHDIHVPSLVQRDWRFANDPEGLRKMIFTGHAGMPTWGVAGISPREIDAVSYYVLHQLRPDVLGDSVR